MSNKSKTCFVIAPIGDEDSEIRHRSDQIMKHVIDPAVQECGYKATRADNISKPGIITHQVIQHLLEDDLVVADLTGHNPNVFYELAIRHAVRKPVVQMIQKNEPIPFDVSASRTIHVDHHDLDSVENCRRDLTRQIRAAEKNPADVDTPISMAIDLQNLQRSGNPVQKSTAEIISLLQDIRLKIDNLAPKRGASGMSKVESIEEARRQLLERIDALRARREALATAMEGLDAAISGTPKTSPKHHEMTIQQKELQNAMFDLQARSNKLEHEAARLARLDKQIDMSNWDAIESEPRD